MTDQSDTYVEDRLREEGEKLCGPTHSWETQQVCKHCGLIRVSDPRRDFDPLGLGEWDDDWGPA
jgi:hypothetical protein